MRYQRVPASPLAERTEDGCAGGGLVAFGRTGTRGRIAVRPRRVASRKQRENA